MSEEQKPRGEDRRVADRRFGWLISEWRKAYRWLSIQFAGIGILLTAVYEMLPQAQAYVPQKYYNVAMLVCLVAVILGRLKNQPVKDAKP